MDNPDVFKTEYNGVFTTADEIITLAAGKLTTSSIGIIGITDKGPVNKPILIESAQQFIEIFGAPDAASAPDITKAVRDSLATAPGERLMPPDFGETIGVRLFKENLRRAGFTNSGADTIVQKFAALGVRQLGDSANEIIPELFESIAKACPAGLIEPKKFAALGLRQLD
jgi:hypothetical protein